MRLYVDYGYDVHSITLDDATFSAFKVGKKSDIDGQGFVHEEDGDVQDHWILHREPGEILFWLDNGAEFYAHNFWVEEA
ncbi:hypothetical protein [Mesorhizobium captivum]|uniref:hypothetical protein n=2 Tax=Mesorhizobium TaxID=68287 RepID=UPI002A24EE5D|nr:hypothetical protein [Mesorhizobium sp. VK3C]MDX8445343.1 hypothetical protein [Mesorhizobium sp. VK3C]